MTNTRHKVRTRRTRTTVGGAKHFHEMGSRPLFGYSLRDWHGAGNGVLYVGSRWISTFLLLLKLKGIESAAWPWLYPVPELCDSALKELQDDEGDAVRQSNPEIE